MGWFFVAIGIIIIHFYVWKSYQIENKHNLKYEFIHLILLLPCCLYFYLFFHHQTGNLLTTILSYEAGFYLVTLLYFAIFLLFLDIFSLITKKHKTGKQKMMILLISILISIFSLYQGTQLKVKKYQITLPQKNATITSMRAMMLSDIHLGTTITIPKLYHIQTIMKKENPDIIFIVGDLFDEGTSSKDITTAIDILSQLKSLYGIYYVIGNHEYNVKKIDIYLEEMKNKGIHVLKDEEIIVKNQIRVIGRDDQSQNRKELKFFEDSNYPTILLDHHPCKENRADLVLSAHTHDGQIVPFHWSDQVIGQMTYGYYKKFHTIVTSGIGTWGIPVRMGSFSELVEINITFQNTSL